MSSEEFRRLLDEAETEVEVDLNERYEVPFKTIDCKPFDKLPDSTKRQLLLLLEHKAVVLALDYSFGYGSVVDAENYTKNLRKRYEGLVEMLLEKRRGGQDTGWARPPLAGLLISYNNLGDSGFIGSVLVTGDSDGDFPKDRINNPAQSFGYNDGIE
jgi:hypothetical protein